MLKYAVIVKDPRNTGLYTPTLLYTLYLKVKLHANVVRPLLDYHCFMGFGSVLVRKMSL